MRIFHIMACSVLAAGHAGTSLAEAPPMTAAEVAFAERFVDAACLPSRSDTEHCDLVLLLRSETLDGMVDLMFVRDEVSVVARDFALHGPLEGRDARLVAEANGTVLVQSQQAAYGRTPWFETLTVSDHQGALSVVRYHYNTYDRATGGDFSCSVDLVSGSWQVSAVRVDPETGDETLSWEVAENGYPDVTEIVWWSFREPPAHCEGIFVEWLDAAP